MNLYSIWEESKVLANGYTISGNSVAGVRTSFRIHDLNILLDAGHQCFNKIQDIFITHTHADHIASLPLMVLENISNKLVTKIYCPSSSKVFLINMLESFLACNYNNGYLPKKYYEIIGVDNSFTMDLKLNGKAITVEFFNSDHTVPTLSYGFIEKKKN